VVRALVRDFNKFTYGRWKKEFKEGMVPFEFESCDWWLEHKGRKPAFWQYVKHSACHWLVNFNLELAQLVMPEEQWRIVTSDKHSTVWNGSNLLFDFNFLALGISAEECFELANSGGKVLKSGKHRRCSFLEYYMDEIECEKRTGLGILAA